MGLWAAAQVLREKGQTCQGRKMRVRDRGMGEHTSDREGEETERQEDSENAHGCGEKGERRGVKTEIEYKSVLIEVVDRLSLLFVWAAIAVTSTGGKKSHFKKISR